MAMMGDLTPEAIEKVLLGSHIGRLGCSDGTRVYVVPITFAYDGSRIICHTSEGMKTQMMRANPNVCFEVEQVQDLANWRSVIAWGVFAELTGEEATKALEFLAAGIMPHLGGLAMDPKHGRAPLHGLHPELAVVFAITLAEKTGRFAKRDFHFSQKAAE